MADIAFSFIPNAFAADFVLASGDLMLSSEIESAIYVSMFTDQRASPDYLSANADDPRGFFGDTYERRPIGSLFWQLSRAKISNGKQLLLRAKTYALEALQWLIDDGVVSRIEVETARLSSTSISIAVTIVEPSPPVGSGNASSFQYSYAWDGV